jgi:uncharacterized membrane protein
MLQFHRLILFATESRIHPMTKTRLEAFSDGVLAIIITIMVLEIKIPHDTTFSALAGIAPTFISYLMSFVFVAIYWGNHHHLLHTVHRVNSWIIWSNNALLFTLSLIPFCTGWMGENHFDELPVACYGANLALCAIAFYFLQKAIIADNKKNERLLRTLKKQEKKGILSLALYLSAIPFAFYLPIVSAIFYVTTAILWIVPDKNIEEALRDE